MNWLRLLFFSLLCCLGGSTLNTLAQSRPLRQTQHHAPTPTAIAQTAAAQAKAAAALTQTASDLLAKAAAAQAQAAQVQTAAEQEQAQAAARRAQAATPAQAADAANQVTLRAKAARAQVQAAEAQVEVAKAAAAQAAAARAAAEQAQAAADQAQVAAPPPGKICWFAPASHCYSTDDPIKGVNDFYGTAENYSFINQARSIYNGASGTTTVSANIASLNFPLGLQLIFNTNVQAGVTTPNNVTNNSTATLAPTSAAQAAQNMINGGTFNTAAIFPLVYHGLADASSPGGVIFSMDAIGKGGVDIQNFKSGTSTTVNNPPTHGNLGLESYLQINSSSLAEATNDVLGDVFVGGSYGYNYTSHGYARDYGFGKRVDSGVGQLVIGAILSKIATITISRGFGPAQTYIDSTGTSMVPIRVNTFKAWSFGLTYQKPSKAPAS